eukprot:CAMPEP_0174875246 /NCGR_PEP_ID=MMETSP1114-20130205/78047_1 /TAXON_ID=312471 /ORGANISM="Neobodo designis, Strain CCAP 1951/1" /LENGTH=141 /DNA_ID=CAMNT_0016110593 /DNA_START=109 /DNA_END=534 /DNA_ORIENTATION=+
MPASRNIAATVPHAAPVGTTFGLSRMTAARTVWYGRASDIADPPIVRCTAASTSRSASPVYGGGRRRWLPDAPCGITAPAAMAALSASRAGSAGKRARQCAHTSTALGGYVPSMNMQRTVASTTARCCATPPLLCSSTPGM